MTSAIDVIRQAVLDQTFFDRLIETENQSLRDAELGFQSAMPRAEAANRACDLCVNNQWTRLVSDMSAGIIALNAACKVLNIPTHERTTLVAQQWGDD